MTEESHQTFGEEDVDGGVGVDGHLELQSFVLPLFPWLSLRCGHHGLVVRRVEQLPQVFSAGYYLLLLFIEGLKYSQPLRVTSGLYTSSNFAHKLNTMQNMHTIQT